MSHWLSGVRIEILLDCILLVALPISLFLKSTVASLSIVNCLGKRVFLLHNWW